MTSHWLKSGRNINRKNAIWRRPSLPATVLDSFALIAYFRGEPGGVPVKALLQKASAADKPVHMTDVKYAEVKDTVLRKDGVAAWNEAVKTLNALPIEFHPV